MSIRVPLVRTGSPLEPGATAAVKSRMRLRALSVIGLGLVGIAGLAAYLEFGALLPWRQDAEVDRLAEVLGVKPGQTVADIGAGGGRFSVRMARAVGPSGKVYSTELTAENRDAIRARADAAGIANLVVIEAAPLETNLPDGCCDAVFLRNVYHHISDPDGFARSLRKAVRPGGRLGIIDFPPGALWWPFGRPSEASERRSGHGVALAAARTELTAAGFQVEREIPDWSGPMWLIVLTPR